jgi:beta-carotene hydroxylase
MYKPDTYDQQALSAAQQYMGRVAWPTIVLGVLVGASYVATPLLLITGVIPLLAAFPLMVVLTYAAYTVLHDAAHGSISGSNRSLRWLNEALGYMAAWITMVPLTAHRHEHLAHHRNTNQPDGDPDFIVANMARTPLHAAWAGMQVFLGQFKYYYENRWNKGPRAQDLHLCLEVCAAILPRLAFIAMGYWLEGLVLFGVAWICGLSLLLFLFAYIVHTPHKSVGRYLDTSTFVMQGVLGSVVTALWGYQNYHSIHHLFPRVPFYYYRRLFGDIEATMLIKGAPIYRLNVNGRLFPAMPTT